MIEQCAVDAVAGELGIAHRLTDRDEVGARVGQGDAGSPCAEIDEDDHAAAGQPRCDLQGRERRGGVGDQRGGNTVGRQARHAAQGSAQGADRAGTPV